MSKSNSVEAFSWFKNGDHPNDGKETFVYDGEETLCEGEVVRYFRDPWINEDSLCPHCNVKIHNHGWIDEDDGRTVCPGDYVITINGKHYPCKPDLLHAMYKPVDEKEGG